MDSLWKRMRFDRMSSLFAVFNFGAAFIKDVVLLS